jgi:anti-sigma-K factor RskA
MILLELTTAGSAATTARMSETEHQGPRSGWRAVRAAAMLLAGSLAISGCISVNAPDKPIVIELNINIKQEVIYRLANDVKENIEANPEIF